MNQLVIGARGQLGSEIYSQLRQARELVAVINSNVIDAGPLFEEIQQFDPDVIYYCAGLTDVDRCQREPELSYAVNVQGVVNVSTAAPHAFFVFPSSDYIFDGNGPHPVGTVANPLNVYGKHKLFAEHYLLNEARCAIFRTCQIFGGEKSFAHRILTSLRQGENPFADPIMAGTPTYVEDLAATIIEYATLQSEGVYHVAGDENLTRYEFACQIAEHFGFDRERIVPRAFYGLAERPLHGGLRGIELPLDSCWDRWKARATH